MTGKFPTGNLSGFLAARPEAAIPLAAKTAIA